MARRELARGRAGAVWIGATLCVVPPAARAQGGAGIAPTRAELRQVLTRELPDGCRYRVIVMGALERAGAPAREDDDEHDEAAGDVRYAPQLRITADVLCPALGMSAPLRDLVGSGMTGEALAEAAAARTQVRTFGAHETCRYTPAFSVGARGLSLDTLARDCTHQVQGAD
jgi:hypothetical protein